MAPETRIISRPRRDGSVEVSVYVPSQDREHRTGLTVPAREEEATLQKLKDTLERSGNHVTHKTL